LVPKDCRKLSFAALAKSLNTPEERSHSKLGYGTHSRRRTLAAEIDRKTANLRAVQLLLGHSKVDGTVRYFGIELGDALITSEQIDI